MDGDKKPFECNESSRPYVSQKHRKGTRINIHKKKVKKIFDLFGAKKVPTTDRGSILIKTLIKIIESHESEIVKFEKKCKKYGLSITLNNKIRRNYGVISRTEIAKILGISRETLMKRWLKYIEKGQKIELNFSTIAKMKANLSFLQNTSAYKPFTIAFCQYETFIDQIYNIFTEYIDVPLDNASGIWLSSVLRKHSNYLTEFSYPLRRDKIIYLLVSIHLIGNKDIGYPMKKGNTLNNLKEKCHKFIFQFMKNQKMISNLTVDSNHKHYGKRIKYGLISKDRKDFFDIIIQSLVALSQAHRNTNPIDRNYIFSYTELSEIISYNNSKHLIGSKFANGTPFARAQCKRLVSYLRKIFFQNPQNLHNTIYEIRKHIIRYFRRWYWNKYDIHFWDLYKPQIKSLLDITLGLDVFNKEFIGDAHQLEKNGYIVEGFYVMDVTRHHIYQDIGYLILEKMEDGRVIFKLALLKNKSHSKLHNLKVVVFSRTTRLIQKRLLFLYKLVKSDCISIIDFRKKDIKEIRDDFSDDILNEWILRWKIYKYSSEKFYETYYNNFFEKMFLPFMRDYKLYKAQNPNSQFPEFWYWYQKYSGEEQFLSKLI